MANFGWVPKTKKIKEKVVYLFKFFRVANQKGFEDYYFHQRTKVAFRISLKGNKNATAIKGFAQKYVTHPACIIGRLQHLQYISYGMGNEFFEKVELDGE